MNTAHLALVLLALLAVAAHADQTLFAYSDDWVQVTDATQSGRGLVILATDEDAMSSHGFLFVEFDEAIPDNSTFAAHVHADTCANDGGGHWMVNTSGPVDTTNEFWFEFTGSGDGTDTQSIFYLAVDNTDVYLDAGAVSVVIHSYEDSSKQLCVDLVNVTSGDYMLIAENTYETAFTPIGAYVGLGYASLWSDAEAGETIGVFAFGLTPALDSTSTFAAHVHNAMCSDGNGGGHWMLNTSGPVDTTNEFWWVFDESDGGEQSTFAQVEVNSNFAMDYADQTIQSIVIHEPDGDRAVCTDLNLIEPDGDEMDDDDDTDDGTEMGDGEDDNDGAISTFGALSAYVVVALCALIYQ